MAKAVHALQFATIGIVIGGDFVFSQPFPSSYEWIRERKFLVGFGAWTLGNSLAQGLVSTGAFEVFYDGQLIYSALNPASKGQLPTLQHIVSGVLRINPALAAARHSPQPPRVSPSKSSSSYSTGASGRNRLVEDDEDVNKDLHDMSYDDV